MQLGEHGPLVIVPTVKIFPILEVGGVHGEPFQTPPRFVHLLSDPGIPRQDVMFAPVRLKFCEDKVIGFKTPTTLFELKFITISAEPFVGVASIFFKFLRSILSIFNEPLLDRI